VSLLREIQDSAIGTSTSIEVLLRQCVLLSARLHLVPLREWANLELNGYPKDATLPPYRPVFTTNVRANLSGAFGRSATNAGLASTSIPDEYDFVREQLFHSEVREGVPQIEALVATGETSFQIPWPPEVLAPLQGFFYQDMIVVDAWQVIPATVFATTLSGIRDRVLQFAIDIEAENPEAGEAAPGDVPIEERLVTQIFHTTILGDNNSVATAGGDVTQNVSTTIDIAGLEAALRGLGVEDEERSALILGVREDESEGSAMPGPRSKAWLARLQSGSIQLGSGVAIGTAVGLVGKLLGVS
jgi:hypothetical protein